MKTPKIGSRWGRPDVPSGAFYYEVVCVTNTDHLSDRHPPQVVYRGSNSSMWSTPLSEWPSKLREIKS
jgi:hypothetical protein